MKYNPADILQFPDRPGRVQLGGRSYAVSDVGVPIRLGPGDELPEQPEGGARVIDAGGNPFRYVWVYQPESERLEMYRLSDGEWKVIASPTDFPRTFNRLQRSGQLNVVTPEEMEDFEAEMRRRYEETMQSLKQAIELDKTEEDRKVEQLVSAFFEQKVLPELERRWAEIDQGVMPFDFEYNERFSKPKEQQAKMHALHATMESVGFSDREDSPLEVYVIEGLGYSSYEDFEDLQALQWALRDFMHERVYPTLES